MRPGPPLRADSFKRAKRALDKVASPLFSCFSPTQELDAADIIDATPQTPPTGSAPARPDDSDCGLGSRHKSIHSRQPSTPHCRRASTHSRQTSTATTIAVPVAVDTKSTITVPTAGTTTTADTTAVVASITAAAPVSGPAAPMTIPSSPTPVPPPRKMGDCSGDTKALVDSQTGTESSPEFTPATSPGLRASSRPPPLKPTPALTPYFPKNGVQTAASLLRAELPERPIDVGPIFDIEHSTFPIPEFDERRHARVYYGASETGEALLPPEPFPSLLMGADEDDDDESSGGSMTTTTDTAADMARSPSPKERYLVPSLTSNERLRLTLLWYHTVGIESDIRLLSKIDTLVKGVQKAIGWEYAIAGILSESTYTRLATANLPIALLPRRESTCSHTINQAPRSVFMVTDMSKDWRFKHSPHVKIGGMRSYAGTQLRLMADDGAEISLGSLCVASDITRPPLSLDQQEFLVRFAELISSSIASHTRQRRLRARQQMTDLLSGLEDHTTSIVAAAADQSAAALDVVREVYPNGQVSLQIASEGRIVIEGRAPIDLVDVHDGIWENSSFIDDTIRRCNHSRLTSSQTVRAIVARCGDSDKYIVVGSRDIHHVFDDFDAWFVSRCAMLVADGLRNQLLKQALEARDTFMRGITHQLRTPIHGILGSVELLEEELTSRHIIMAGNGSSLSTASTCVNGTVPSPVVDIEHVSTSPFACISAIKNAGLELRTTINNILRHNHWNTGLRQCRLAPYDLRFLEADVLPDILSLLPPEQQLGLSVLFMLDFGGHGSVLVTDGQLLRDSVEAVVLNAVQAVLGKPDGSVVVMVQLALDTKTSTHSLTIDVVDNGCGIDSASHQVIFEPYEKVDSYKPGAGLGLTVATRITDALNGSVQLVSSVPGGGSCFRLELKDVTLHDDETKKNGDETSNTRNTLANSTVKTPDNTDGPSPIADADKVLPRTFTDMRTGPAARHFVDHTIAYLEQNGFRRNDSGSVGIVVTNIGPERIASVVAPAYPDAVVVWCGERERNRRGSAVSSLVGLDATPGCISVVGGPLHTQRLDDVLRLAEDMYRNRGRPAKKKKKRTKRRTWASEKETISSSSSSSSPVPTPTEEMEGLLGGLAVDEDTKSAATDVSASPATTIITTTTITTVTTTTTTTPLRALLVDDNPINLRILQMFCKRRSIPYVTATDGNKAIAAYTSSFSAPAQPITLVLMDLQMPHCDGLQATAAIRAFEKEGNRASARVYMVTGQDSEFERDGAIKAGADEFLVKPVGPAELDRVVARWFPGE